MSNQACFSNPGPELWNALGWHPSSEQLEQMIALQALLRQWNARVNLTRLVEGGDYWIMQVFDSLWPLQSELQNAQQPRRCIDIGSGGGFPGLVLAIALPGASITLVDSVGRKTAALKAMAAKLGLTSRVTVRSERAELTGQDHCCRGLFDLAMARAVSTAPVVAEYLVPLLKPSGEALLFRGHWSPNDAKDLAKALRLLQADLIKMERRELPDNRGVRHQLRLRATLPCPATFPRPIGVPTKNPLGS